MRMPLAAIALALALAGCAGLPSPRSAPAGEDGVRATLHYIDRLNAAGAGELAVIGERLERDGSADARMRRAFWQATPGHAGYAPERAARALEGLLTGAAVLDDSSRLLLRVQLEHLRERNRLLDSRAELMARNRELRRQIEELTALERRMGGDDGNGE